MASAADYRRRLVRSCQDCQVTEPDEPLQVVQRLLDGVATGLTPALADLYEADAVVEIAEYDYEGRAIENGRSFVVSNVQIIRVRAGRIVAPCHFHDHAGM